ncbi:MAG: hypothetical protein UX73_C0025G0007 [candidate division WWE3 bacterium GW2011_GWC1_47_10]|uniref:Uncharacterized protein n=1 Tax=candidate division WWE3 bacterium GW2011_GWC1_47_10 TaxID=1619122 RepID=A0A0G1T6V2_UNCKA|nr:MAG: hypothetical protein UX73_C0025G0007 [candidate division WWE3 bacterium GW2011_GWC1_47_10]
MMIAAGKPLFPFRTEKLSPPARKILSQVLGKIRRRQDFASTGLTQCDLEIPRPDNEVVILFYVTVRFYCSGVGPVRSRLAYV